MTLLRTFAFTALMTSLLASSIASQETPPPPPAKADLGSAEPKGIEVLTRGPVHEAFATPTTEAQQTKPVPKPPPQAIDELPPAEKPQGAVQWIGGYWAWDDDRNDFLWVSGVWRTPPPGKQWISGYWKKDAEEHRWVPGFWAADAGATQQDVTYLPAPPPPPEIAPPGEPPSSESFYVPGHWVYRGGSYAWVAGYWGRVQPGYVWIASHYRWTPGGYIFIPGYWDLAVSRRGVLYAPVIVHAHLVGPSFVYTPAYIVSDTVLVESLFLRPVYCHYYFGDYYGPVYRDLGFESCITYSRRRYDAIFVYERYSNRHDPGWESFHLGLCIGRHSGHYPCPPRTLVQQNIVINNVTNVQVNRVEGGRNGRAVNNQVVMPSSQIASAKGIQTTRLTPVERSEARQSSQASKQVALERLRAEAPPSAQGVMKPRTQTIKTPTGIPASRRDDLTRVKTEGITKPGQAPIAASRGPAAQQLTPKLGGVATMPGGKPGEQNVQPTPVLKGPAGPAVGQLPTPANLGPRGFKPTMPVGKQAQPALAAPVRTGRAPIRPAGTGDPKKANEPKGGKERP